MTAQEAISNLRDAHEPVEFFLYLAAHAHELRLSNGARLNDATDWKAFMVELAEATKPTIARVLGVPPQRRWNSREVDPTCPRCGHVHQGIGECGMPMGAGRICHCELEVAA